MEGLNWKTFCDCRGEWNAMVVRREEVACDQLEIGCDASICRRLDKYRRGVFMPAVTFRDGRRRYVVPAPRLATQVPSVEGYEARLSFSPHDMASDSPAMDPLWCAG